MAEPVVIVSEADERAYDSGAALAPLRVVQTIPERAEGGDPLIASLGHMAAAVASAMSLEEVLQCIVDEAKLLTQARKVVLSLAGEGAVRGDDSVVVRGSRQECPETFWRDPLHGLACLAMTTGVPEVVHTPEMLIACVPMMLRERATGWLGAMFESDRELTSDDLRLLAVVGTLAASSIENARLAARARRALIAEEHDRLAREMHDGLSQTLFGVALQLQFAAKNASGESEVLTEALRGAQGLIAQTMTEVRRFAHDMRPSRLERLGLADAVRGCVNEMSLDQFTARVLVHGIERELPLDIETCLYRIAQEALTNVVKHAGATRLDVVLGYEAGAVTLRVEDDGRGFAPRRAGQGRSLGLQSIRERVSAVAGEATMTSSVSGTVVSVRIPCD